MSVNTDRRQGQLADIDRLYTSTDQMKAQLNTMDNTLNNIVFKLDSRHDEEHEYLKQVIAREARRAALHQAIIEKTLAALLWAGISGVMYFIWEGVKMHLPWIK